jgi:hypothetical protein
LVCIIAPQRSVSEGEEDNDKPRKKGQEEASTDSLKIINGME